VDRTKEKPKITEEAFICMHDEDATKMGFLWREAYEKKRKLTWIFEREVAAELYGV
jgi:hypothetical protein